jgi:broad specificity phosphatase PhoE
MLILVRHAMPLASKDISPHDWQLSDEGMHAAQALAAVLPSDAYLASSDEPKAWMTLGGATRQVTQDQRFNEVTRPDEPWNDDFRARRRGYVEGQGLLGWEKQQAVATRFDIGFGAHTSMASGRPLVIASHGMAMTLWLVSRGLVSEDAAGEFWSELRFPDAHVVDLDAGVVRRLSRD